MRRYLGLWATTASGQPADLQLPFMAGDDWWCSQGWNGSFSHGGEAAWDYNYYGGDLGYPLLAAGDGRIVFAGRAKRPDGTNSPYGNVVLNDYGESYYGRNAHFHRIVVREGEYVRSGQVIGFCGTTGVQDDSWPSHVHYDTQRTSDPNGQDYTEVYVFFKDRFGNDQYGYPEPCNCTEKPGIFHYISRNAGVFDREEVLQGLGNVGSRQGAVHWWHGWVPADLYVADPNHRARRCYIADYDGGTWGACAIVYDALGGARKAYTVRTGFWDSDQESPHNGWSEEAGPQGPHGMPITNELPSEAGGAWQGFQTGQVVCDPGQQVTWSPYPVCAPGWTGTGWNDEFSYLFALAFERNGGVVNCGLPTGNVYEYGPEGAKYKCQDLLRDGEYCTIFYDPNNAVGNDLATNEAYLLRTGFRAYYFANGGYQAFGCPTRDEYLSRDPLNWDDPTLYPLQNFKADGSPDHYMISKNGVIDFHSSYTTAYVSQNPSGQINMFPGETRTFTGQFRNTGTTTWHNDPIAYPYYYVEEKSCDASGNIMASFLNYPYDAGLGWLNLESPCTMNEASVPPGGIATFTFQGKVAADATPGLRQVYFRPNHSMVGEMDDWGGMHYQVNVVIPPSPGPGLACDALVMDWVTGDLHVGLNGNGLFDPDGYWETGWIHGATANDFRLFTSGSNADEYQDLCALSVRLGNWDELTTNGLDFYTHRQLLSNWKAYTGGDQKHYYFMADATGDGKPDAIHVATHTGVASVARRSGSVLVPDANVWITSFRNGALNTHQFFAGDVTGDGKADLLAREVSTGNWHLAKSTGSTFTTSGITNPVLTNWTADALTNLEFQIALSDLDADGKDELVCYRPRVGTVSWCDWNGTSFTKMGTLTTNWGVAPDDLTRYRLLTGDLNHDSKKDFCLFKADGGNWYCGISTGTSITSRSTWREDFGNSTDQTRYRPYLFDVGLYSNGGVTYRVPVDTLETAVQATGQLAFRIIPNPARGAIELWFDRPQPAVTSFQVFDLQGRLLRSITDPGLLEGNPLWWDGRDGQDRRVPAGVYFLRITTVDQSLTRRVTVVR